MQARVRVAQCDTVPPRNPSPKALVCISNARDRVCNGDSGGFLGSPRGRGGRWVVEGVTSFGVAGCPARGVSTFTSVAYFHGWIITTARRN